MQTMAPVTPPQWQPPPTWQPPPQFGPWRSQPLPFRTVSSPLVNRIPFIAAGFIILTSLAGFVPVLVGLLGSAAPKPAPAEPRAEATLSIDRLVRSSPFGVQARTGERASVVTGSAACPGFIPRAPQLAVRIHRQSFVAIVPSSPDAVLVLRRPSGEYLCSNAEQPAILGVLTSGSHRLWVGSVRDDVTSSLTLSFRASLPRGDLRPYSTPSLGALSESRTDLWTTATYRAKVEPAVDISGLGCQGFVSPVPQLTLDLERSRAVAFAFEQHTDELVLLVRTSGGRFFCETVAPGEASALAFDLPRGESAVWVGATSLATPAEYTLATRAAD